MARNWRTLSDLSGDDATKTWEDVDRVPVLTIGSFRQRVVKKNSLSPLSLHFFDRKRFEGIDDTKLHNGLQSSAPLSSIHLGMTIPLTSSLHPTLFLRLGRCTSLSDFFKLLFNKVVVFNEVAVEVVVEVFLVDRVECEEDVEYGLNFSPGAGMLGRGEGLPTDGVGEAATYLDDLSPSTGADV